MLVEIRDSSIKLEIPGKAGEQYIIEEGRPIDPVIFGLAHRYPGALSEAVGKLIIEAPFLDNGSRRFVNSVADSLNTAIIAVRNSEEF